MERERERWSKLEFDPGISKGRGGFIFWGGLGVGLGQEDGLGVVDWFKL